MTVDVYGDAPSESFLEQGERADAAPWHLRLLTAEEALVEAPAFAALLGLWQERSTDGAPPDWDELDFSDFRGWHAALVVSDFEGAEPDPLFRIVGEDWRIVPLTGYVGRRFGSVMPAFYERQAREHFWRIRETGLIGLSIGPAVQVDREHLRLNVLELPFRRGGRRVERLVHALRNGSGAHLLQTAPR